MNIKGKSELESMVLLYIASLLENDPTNNKLFIILKTITPMFIG